MGKLFGTDGVRGTANMGHMTASSALQIGAAVGRYFRTRRRCEARGDRQGHAALGLHVRERADGGADLDRHECPAAGSGADACGGAADPVDARGSGRHDLRLAQSRRGQRHQVLRARRLQALRRGRGRNRGARRVRRRSGTGGRDRAGQEDRRWPLPLCRAGEEHLPAPDAAGRCQGRRGLRAWCGLSRGAPGTLGAGRRRDRSRGQPERPQHQPQLRVHVSAKRGPSGDRAWRGSGDMPRWRRGPGDPAGRKGTRRRWRSTHGADGRALDE